MIYIDKLVTSVGVEPTTAWLETMCSIQLSYEAESKRITKII